MGEEHTTHARVPARSIDPTAERVRQLILSGEPTFSPPKRFPKGSIRITPQPTTTYAQLLAKLATRRQPSIAELARLFACGVVMAFALAFAVFVAVR
jgi:hypothetical protein